MLPEYENAALVLPAGRFVTIQPTNSSVLADLQTSAFDISKVILRVGSKHGFDTLGLSDSMKETIGKITHSRCQIEKSTFTYFKEIKVTKEMFQNEENFKLIAKAKCERFVVCDQPSENELVFIIKSLAQAPMRPELVMAKHTQSKEKADSFNTALMTALNSNFQISKVSFDPETKQISDLVWRQIQ
jgi:hypothetical protein